MDLINLRTEVWHPLTVHFPIVLLSIASVCSWLYFFKGTTGVANTLRWSSILGTFAVWLAVYTGDLADGIVGRQLCDPTVLKDHENLGVAAAWVYTGLSLLVLIQNVLRHRSFRVVKVLMASAGLAGLIILIYQGHLGASLVYDQAAGVNVPGEDCAGF